MGRSGELLLGWEKEVTIYQVQCTSFSIEVEFETVETKGSMWAIFVYASNRDNVRYE